MTPAEMVYGRALSLMQKIRLFPSPVCQLSADYCYTRYKKILLHSLCTHGTMHEAGLRKQWKPQMTCGGLFGLVATIPRPSFLLPRLLVLLLP